MIICIFVSNAGGFIFRYFLQFFFCFCFVKLHILLILTIILIIMVCFVIIAVCTIECLSASNFSAVGCVAQVPGNFSHPTGISTPPHGDLILRLGHCHYDYPKINALVKKKIFAYPGFSGFSPDCPGLLASSFLFFFFFYWFVPLRRKRIDVL